MSSKSYALPSLLLMCFFYVLGSASKQQIEMQSKRGQLVLTSVMLRVRGNPKTYVS